MVCKTCRPEHSGLPSKVPIHLVHDAMANSPSAFGVPEPRLKQGSHIFVFSLFPTCVLQFDLQLPCVKPRLFELPENNPIIILRLRIPLDHIIVSSRSEL
ncbi:hypothetical protein V2G26_008205 [Clonostachys chloroleuca]